MSELFLEVKEFGQTQRHSRLINMFSGESEGLGVDSIKMRVRGNCHNPNNLQQIHDDVIQTSVLSVEDASRLVEMLLERIAAVRDRMTEPSDV